MVLVQRLAAITGLTAFAALATPALAVNGQAGVPIKHSFASTCAGSTFGQGFSPGYGPGDGTVTAQRACSAVVSATSGGTAVSSNARTGNSNGFFSNKAKAVATIGKLHLSATNTGSSSNYFSGAQAAAGFNDSITANVSGIILIPIHVDGTLIVNGSYPAGASFNIQMFQNLNALSHYDTPAYSQFVTANGSPPVTDEHFLGFDQAEFWQVERQGADRIIQINKTVTFAVRETAGVAFTLGLYAQLAASEESYGGPGALQNTSTADFAHTVSWGGKGVLLLPGGGTTTNFSLTSASGYNYNVSAVPEPGEWAMLIAGFGVCGLARRRWQQVVAA